MELRRRAAILALALPALAGSGCSTDDAPEIPDEVPTEELPDVPTEELPDELPTDEIPTEPPGD